MIVRAACWIKVLHRRYAADRKRLGKSVNIVDLHMGIDDSDKEAINDGDGGVRNKAAL